MDSPIDYFRSTIKFGQEDPRTSACDADRLLCLLPSDRTRFVDALLKYYAAPHWASNASSFESAGEAFFQLVAAGVCGLRDSEKYRPHDLDCCVRVLRSPSLAAYFTPDRYNYIVLPIGFISSVQSYVSTVFALAALGATDKDPSRSTRVWDSDMILGCLMTVWEKDQWAFLQGILEYSSQLTTASILDSFADILAFIAFDRKMHKQISGMTNQRRLRNLGFTDTETTLAQFPKVERQSCLVIRLLLTYTICHEFGHLFLYVATKDRDLASNETGADLLGMQFMWRLWETGQLRKIFTERLTAFDILSGIAAFHSWNFSKGLAEVLTSDTAGRMGDLQPSLDRVCIIAARWKEIQSTLQKHLSDDTGGSTSEAAIKLTNTWAVPCAGLLLLNFHARGEACDLYKAGQLLSLLASRESKIYEHLSKSKIDRASA